MNAVDNNIWTKLQSEAEDYIKSNEDYKDFLESLVLSNDDFMSSISLKLSRDLSQAWSFSEKNYFQVFLQASIPVMFQKLLKKILMQLFQEILTNTILETLFSKGFSALQAYRASNYHWNKETLYLIFYKAEPRKFMA